MAVAARLQTGQVDVNGGAFTRRTVRRLQAIRHRAEIGEYGIADVLEVKSVQR